MPENREELEVDPERLTALTAKARRAVSNPRRWLAMQFLKAWFVNACVVFVFPALANDRFPAASDFTGRKAVLRLALSLAAAAGI